MIFCTRSLRNHRRMAIYLGSAALVLVCGCHSAFVNASITNRSGRPLRLVEIDYPSASFGTNDLAPGAEFKYRFKVLGSGPATLLWTDAAKKEHTSAGPSLEEGEQGSLTVAIGPDDAQWTSQLDH